MRVTVDNIQYRVKFEYWNNRGRRNSEFAGKALKDLGKKRIETLCTISWTDADNIERRSVGSSIRHPNDKFCKMTGRRSALQKALASDVDLDRKVRKAIWEMYFDMHKDSTRLAISSW